MPTGPLDGVTVDVVPRPPGVLVVIAGEIDAANVGAVGAALEQTCDAVSGDVAMDLAAVQFLGVCGVDLLRRVNQRLAAQGRRLALPRASEVVRRVFELTGHRCPATDGTDEPPLRLVADA